MRIGIIGTGNIGGTLTRRLTKLGHDVAIANSRGPDTLRDFAKETGATPVTVEDAVLDRAIVIVTIPERNIPDLPAGLFDAARPDTIVIDTGNYYPQQRDGRIDDIENGMPESRWVSNHLGRPVIKTFNNIYAKHLMERGLPPGATNRIALPVAGDDEKAKAAVMQLVDSLGFDPIDAGTLDDSWRQQPGTPVYGTDRDAAGATRALAQAKRERPAEFTAAAAR
ncbi:MAG TPA: NAD(P)-binding domain-containing protein [Gemmatimonadaceae bacterium]|nr:NAD(P)-binding domain-containing protein [Gemmatimonadaceae bacterium]